MTIDKDQILVKRILDAIDSIYLFIGDMDESDFVKNDLTSSAVIKKFEIIGEASKRLSQDFRDHHSLILWSQMIGMRNILIHDYIGTDLQGVWNTIHQDLLILKAELKK
jgi:uncharacterized protein with HEPN domain